MSESSFELSSDIMLNKNISQNKNTSTGSVIIAGRIVLLMLVNKRINNIVIINIWEHCNNKNMEYVYINRTTNLFKRQTEFLIKIATLDELDWE